LPIFFAGLRYLGRRRFLGRLQVLLHRYRPHQEDIWLEFLLLLHRPVIAIGLKLPRTARSLRPPPNFGLGYSSIGIGTPNFLS